MKSFFKMICFNYDPLNSIDKNKSISDLKVEIKIDKN